ncbi:hypothetical protein GDI0814 [Gluconacetobacter diazotrophicus PA1 5]|uniref:Uncharacterized protein n=1 Tax=Gluconacetobacter diazotrophicus (strain ATCC 49037 / DSM 5601 / CCUG 37298 / CIP 103539 / LMG 7603 / PAl5) TaxID=272568 RepID=A9HB25_GLUDA|nr:hypothetical protein GDI0814 [Gluconacetobacter diazotrophicus PA1 5]
MIRPKHAQAAQPLHRPRGRPGTAQRQVTCQAAADRHRPGCKGRCKGLRRRNGGGAMRRVAQDAAAAPRPQRNRRGGIARPGHASSPRRAMARTSKQIQKAMKKASCRSSGCSNPGGRLPVSRPGSANRQNGQTRIGTMPADRPGDRKRSVTASPPGDSRSGFHDRFLFGVSPRVQRPRGDRLRWV